MKSIKILLGEDNRSGGRNPAKPLCRPPLWKQGVTIN
jgi:hypothetical protein